jgi:hypothetical protein
LSRPAKTSKAAGATASDIVLIRAYVTDADAFKKNVDALAGDLGPQSVCSINTVPAISAGRDFLVEIEAVANLNPPSAASASAASRSWRV